ncbi:MAG: class I SAM-dependent methyltransferase, partial [Planctomycetes bacterium]|nr:class I SAM-dependent methyltransferase [Planctomycetota bacterium]
LLFVAPEVVADETPPPEGLKKESELPSRYPHVVADMLEACQPKPGTWVDLGAGSGGVSLAMLEANPKNPILMLDPDADAMTKALTVAREKGMQDRLFAIVGVAEDLPFPDDSVDLIASRGSIFFWDDPAGGLREVYRVLRPGARAMIGGGAGSGYPDWATEALIQRRKKSLQGEEAERWEKFVALRRPEQMREWAEQAKLPEYTVMGQGAITNDPEIGQGVWIVFEKKPEVVTRKEADRVIKSREAERSVYTVTCPSGIGAATITTGATWPESVVVRLQLRGLESFTASTDRGTLSVSVSSHNGNRQLLQWNAGGEETEVLPGTPLWTEARVLDEDGKPREGRPDEGGYFELALPPGLFQDQPRSLRLEWIDFYRN